jgi:hypothetical protein
VIKRAAAGPIANRHAVLIRPAPFAMASAGSLREISYETGFSGAFDAPLDGLR